LIFHGCYFSLLADKKSDFYHEGLEDIEEKLELLFDSPHQTTVFGLKYTFRDLCITIWRKKK